MPIAFGLVGDPITGLSNRMTCWKDI